MDARTLTHVVLLDFININSRRRYITALYVYPDLGGFESMPLEPVGRAPLKFGQVVNCWARFRSSRVDRTPVRSMGYMMHVVFRNDGQI